MLPIVMKPDHYLSFLPCITHLLIRHNTNPLHSSSLPSCRGLCVAPASKISVL